MCFLIPARSLHAVKRDQETRFREVPAPTLTDGFAEMRVGTNPLKHANAGAVQPPNPLSICTITCVPEITGYFQHALDIIQLCFESIYANTDDPYDFIVFDNASCPEVERFLIGEKRAGRIQQLILSGSNVGKLGAWNHLFGAVTGEYVVYTDSDVFFRPGWFSAMFSVLSAFPRVGYVAGCGAPFSFRGENLETTLQAASVDGQIIIERGQLVPNTQIIDYAYSVGYHPGNFYALCRSEEQVRMTNSGISAYAATSHWQFLTRKSVLQQILPFSPQFLLGEDSHDWESKIRSLGYMQLAVCEPVVHHLGNVLVPPWQKEKRRLDAQFRALSSH